MINLGKFSNIHTSKDVIVQEQENGCWKCLSHCTDKDGYVRIRYNNKQDRLFRVLYQQKYGTIPTGFVLRHLCNNAWCVNVEHLKIGTQKENYQDMKKCGRSKIGEQSLKFLGDANGQSKLKKQDVKDIYLSNEKNSVLSKKYNVSKTNIYLIKNKKLWKWLTDSLD